MGWVNWVTALVALGGLVIAGLKTWTAISEERAKRFLARSKGLLELRDVVAVEGPMRGSHTSKNAEKAHTDLLLEFEQESRANAVLYLDATSRLAKPGSLVTGIAQCLYATVLIWLAISRLPWNLSTTDPHTIPAIVASIVFVLIGLVVIGLGAHQIIRRLKTRKLRQRVGTLDDLTVEGSAWIIEVPAAMARKLRRR